MAQQMAFVASYKAEVATGSSLGLEIQARLDGGLEIPKDWFAHQKAALHKSQGRAHALSYAVGGNTHYRDKWQFDADGVEVGVHIERADDTRKVLRKDAHKLALGAAAFSRPGAESPPNLSPSPTKE